MSERRPTRRTQSLVLAGHGSQRHPRSAAPVHAHADRIRERGAFDDVRVAFWKEEPTLRDVVAEIETDAAFVVPVLTSEGYFADEVFPRELGVDDPAGRPGSVDLRYAEPVGTHPAMTSVVRERVEAVRGGPPEDVGVALVGHGTERNERSADATVGHAAVLRDTSRYAAVEPLFLDEAPFVGELYDRLDAPELVVVPLFVADGYHTTHDVPRAIGNPGIGESATVDGRVVHYTGAVGTEPSLADVVVERAVEAGATVEMDRPSRARSTAGDAFLRWVDASADGRTWGELAVARRADGHELRHRTDADARRRSLATVPDPTSIRDAVRYDDRGRYRPLTGARTLPTGWVLKGLDAVEFVRAVEFVYPGSVAYWDRERTGELSVTHFPETVARQTGIYADLDDLDDAELAAATDAVCGTCVRRRRWGWSDDDARDGCPDRGDGVSGAETDDGDTRADDEIPCREACPFLLSATHAFFEEREAATGPDPDVPAGAFDLPGNPYRVRYARALDDRSDTVTGAPRPEAR